MGLRHGVRAEWRWKTCGGMDMRFEVQIRRGIAARYAAELCDILKYLILVPGDLELPL
eukprot:gene1249-32597_t